MNQKARVCIISPEVVGPHKNGGVGTHSYYLSAFLSQELGQQVTFVYTGKIEAESESYWKRWFRRNLGVEFVWIAPRKLELPFGLHSQHVDIARRTYEYLREQQFDVCHFQEMLGNGYRCFQAKRLGLAFRETTLTCTVHSSWEWICQAMQSLPQWGAEELQTKYMERYCTEHCDVLLSPSQYMLRWVDREGLKPTAPRYVLPYLFDPQLRPVGYRDPARHIIFFGRLEVRKGLLLFLESLLLLDRQKAFEGAPLKVTFLGKSGYTPDGGGSHTIKKYAAQFSAEVHLEELTDLGQPEALKYLRTHNDALVVCPSLVDNSPYAVIESLQLGLNLIAADCGGIPELFGDKERLFAPEPRALAAKLKLGLANELPPLVKAYDLKTSARLWREFCQKTLPSLAPGLPQPANFERKTQVHVFMPPPESRSETVQLLGCLQGQTYKNYTVTVVTDPETWSARPVPMEFQAACRERGWAILTEPPPAGWLQMSGGSARCALFLGRGSYPRPHLFETLVQSHECSGAEYLSVLALVTRPQLAQFAYQPLGPCLEGGPYANFFGAGCFMAPIKDVPESFEELRHLFRPAGFWPFLAKAALAGKRFEVVPDMLLSLEATQLPLTCAELDYPDLLEVIGCYTGSSPWLRYLFINSAAKEQKILNLAYQLAQTEQQIKAISNAAPSKILFKLKRETRRIINQAQALYRGAPVKSGSLNP